MKSSVTCALLLLPFRYHRVGAISARETGRAEIFSNLTSGELRYLKVEEEKTYYNSRMNFKASVAAMENTTLHKRGSTMLEEVFHLAKKLDFNSS